MMTAPFENIQVMFVSPSADAKKLDQVIDLNVNDHVLISPDISADDTEKFIFDSVTRLLSVLANITSWGEVGHKITVFPINDIKNISDVLVKLNFRPEIVYSTQSVT